MAGAYQERPWQLAGALLLSIMQKDVIRIDGRNDRYSNLRVGFQGLAPEPVW
ncbi:MAG: hypothetical protein VX252_11220 [Myxococcota bacterium]|nr:hypothetical protein [Myxococcota bacterium]